MDVMQKKDAKNKRKQHFRFSLFVCSFVCLLSNSFQSQSKLHDLHS